MRLRVLVSFAALCLGAPAAPALAVDDLDMEVRDIPSPTVTGQAGDYKIRMRATVANESRTEPTPQAEVTFVLAPNGGEFSRSTLRLAPRRVDELRPLGRHTLELTVDIDSLMDPGVFQVVACVHPVNAFVERFVPGTCAGAQRMIAITERGGMTNAQAGDPAPGATPATSAPRPEWIPEQQPTMKVSAPMDCPGSLHGQAGGDCVWVPTPTTLGDEDVSGLASCPEKYGFPFEMAQGFEPVWRNDGRNSKASVRPVAQQRWLLYRSAAGRDYFPSWGAPTAGGPGYVSINFDAQGSDRVAHRVSYLCAEKPARAMLP
jgi:hypothetical protein